MFSDYETKMKKNNCLDFDDLLIYGWVVWTWDLSRGTERNLILLFSPG